MSESAEELEPSIKRGRKLGDARTVVDRPTARYFRHGEQGTLIAKAAAIEPDGRAARLGFGARRVVFGRVLSTHEELEQRLPKWKALAVFSSDVMSSVAYATEASMFTLLAVGTIAFGWLMPISLLIVGLLILVTFSYRQTIRAYPQGGGSYIVAHANLGVVPGLVAAAALLTDYVLTVSVSVASGVFNLASAFPALQDLTVPLIVIAIFAVMAVNLRGISESATAFALPTYVFIGSVLLLVGAGLVRTAMGQPPQVTGVEAIKVPVESMSLLLLMRAFADGCSAMTGTEAISNGTPAFKPPEWKNAQTTMVAMAAVLGVVFLGISYLAGVSGAVPSEHVSVLAQIGAAVFGSTPLYSILIFSTMGILVLAAQTSFADFPRLASILAKDGFMPRRFAYRGERLAFNAGIIVLAVIASVVVVFRGRVEALIPLYAIGVFTAFTLSQAGMVRHWVTERSEGWRRSAIINGTGAVATGIVAIVFAVAKFALGAWIIILVVPALVIVMLLIRHEYSIAERDLFVRPDAAITAPHRRQRVVVPLTDMRRDAIQAIKLGLTMTDNVVAVHVTDDMAHAELLRQRFRAQVEGVELLVLESPYRDLVQPLIRYLEMVAARDPETVTVVLVPERIIRHWWERPLYNQNAHRIRDALTGHPGILVADVPYRRVA